MKRLVLASAVAGFLVAIPVSDVVWGKAHVPLGKVQVCHKGEVITVSQNALGAHQGHSDCQLPACDFNNVFFTGDACGFTDTDADGRCDGLNPRADAGGVTPACPAGTF